MALQTAAQVAATQQVSAGGPATAAEVYQALRAQRNELRNQLNNLEDQRRSLANRIQQPNTPDGSRAGLEARLKEVDARISTVDKQLATADEQVARQAAVPGSVVPEPRPIDRGPPEEVVALGALFMLTVLLPISIAFARRIWRRGAAAVSSLPGELMDRLTRIEQAVDAIAVEVERVGESQRFVTSRMIEGSNARALGAGAAEPIGIKAREGAEVRR